MDSTEYKYRLNRLARAAGKTTGKIVDHLFLLASLATVGLLVCEFGYDITDNWGARIGQAYRWILRLFFYGSLIRIALHPRTVWKEKGFWVEIALLLTLLFLLVSHRSEGLLSHLLLLFISVIHLSKFIVANLQRHIRPEIMFAGSFATFILLGAVLLMLPKSHHAPLGFLDALFTSTSAVCITGLSTVDIPATFTFTGQLILLLLIQIGGIGVMTFTSFIALSFFTQTSFTDQMALKSILNEESMNNIFRTLLYTLLTTLVAEAAGACFLWWQIRDLPPQLIADKVFCAIFHAVSAFCNAGFSTLSGNLCHPAIRHLYGFQCGIALLVIVGGIGFPIVFNYGKLLNHKLRNLFYRLVGSDKRMPTRIRIVTVTTRIAVTTTLVLLVGGTALYALFENKGVLAGLPWQGKLTYAFFGAVTPRTAGFNNVDIARLASPTLLLTLCLMWVGASPLSTGGGIKTTTFTVVLKNLLATLRGETKTEIFKRRLPPENIRRAHAIVLLSLLWIVTATLLLCRLMPESPLPQVLFEVVSALGTVGLSLDFTARLTAAAKVIICLSMFVGRVGLITLLPVLIPRRDNRDYTYAEENVIL